MKIAICGDSYFCADSYYKNTHFSELLAKDHNVINFATVGASGLDICSQIDNATKIRPDVIIAKSSNDTVSALDLENILEITTWCYAHLIRKCVDLGITVLFDCNADVTVEYNDFCFISDNQTIYLGDILPLEPLPESYLPKPIYHTDYITQQNIHSYLLKKFKENNIG